MSLLPSTRRALTSKIIRPSLAPSRTPFRPFPTTTQFQPPFRPPLFHPFSASTFFRREAPPLQQNPNQEDGLRNNRDLPDRISKVSVADLNLLSKLPPPPQSREAVPSYAMVFTCKQCSERSAHKVSKQGYHEGTVLITCPGCKSRHLVSDHLKIFSDTRVTLEDILAEKGHHLKRLAINENGDLEFWEKPEAASEVQKSLPAS